MQFSLKPYLWFLKQTHTVHCFDFENMWMILNLITYMKKLCTFDDWKWVHFSCICKGSNYNLIQCAVKISSVLAFCDVFLHVNYEKVITWFPVQFGVNISKTSNCTRKIHLCLLTHCTWSHVITYTNCIPLTWMTIYLFIKAITCTCWTITEVKQCMVLRETVSFVSWRVLIRTPGKSKLTSFPGDHTLRA